MKKFLASTLALTTLLAVNVSAAANLVKTADEIDTSTYYNDDYSGEQVRDGIVRGEEFLLHQWITDYEPEADLTLTWSSPVTLTKAVLYDRISATDNVASGSITFYDGTVVEFGALDPDGLPTEVAFDAVTTTSAVIHVVADDGTLSVGLDEVEFYDENGVNIAPSATATASSVLPDQSDNEEYVASWYSESYTNWYGAEKVINGYAKANVPEGAEFEWASQGEANPTITINWYDKITVGTIVLYDRVNANDHVIGGVITFSDGSEIEFDEIPNDGAPYYIDVPDKETTSIEINTVTEGPNPGFAEIEVYTEHFENGKPIGETEEAPVAEAAAEETTAPETVEETTAETVEEAAPETTETVEETAAPETVEAEETVETAPQTSDISAVLGAIALSGMALLKAVSKKRS